MNFHSIIRKLKHVTLLVGIYLFSCEEVVDLDLPTGEKLIVISGWITNQPGPYEVTITETIGFNNQNPNPGVGGAQVFTTDRLGIRYDFTETENVGVYRSDPDDLRGIPGNAYVLHVILEDGTEYASDQQVLNPVPDLEDVSIDSFLDVINSEPNFFVKGFILDEPSIRNFYRWRVFVNGNLQNTPDDLIVFNDKFTDGRRFENRADNILLNENDVVILEHWSLSEGAFRYYELLISQTKSDFGGTNTPPAIVHGNLSNINDNSETVLGFFGASEILNYDIEVTL